MQISRAKVAGLLVLSFLMFFQVPVRATDNSQKAILRVDGLACSFCAYGLEKKLKHLDGIKKLDIKINEGLVTLQFQEGASIDKEAIFKKVKEAGFTPREFKVERASEPVTGKAADKIVLNIKGMTCGKCPEKVAAALRQFDCVKDITVDQSGGKASFTCTDPTMEPTRFVQSLEKLGFRASISGQ